MLNFTPPPLTPRDPRFVHKPPELCQLAGVWTGEQSVEGWTAEEKIDGIRALWFDGALWTREGVPLDIPHVADALAALERRFGVRMMLDGEYREPGGLRETVAVIRSGGRRPAAGIFHLFDAVPLHHWHGDDCAEPLSARRSAIDLAWGSWNATHLLRSSASTMTSVGHVEGLARAVWSRGGEGLMLKQLDGLYRRRRSSDWRKLKQGTLPQS